MSDTEGEAVDPAEDPALQPEGAVGPEDLRQDLVSEHGTQSNGEDRDHLGDDEDEQAESD